MNQPQALYRLQLLESSLDDAKARLDEIDATLHNNEAIRDAQKTLKARASDHQRAHATVTDLELEIETLNNKQTEVNEMLYSGKLTNPKELQERQDELESLKRRQIKLESELVAARESLKQFEIAHDEAKENFTEVEAEQHNQQQGLIEEQQGLKVQMKDWLKERKVVLKEVEPGYHKIYKRIKPQKQGMAVVRLDDNMCSACRAEQNLTIIHQVRQTHEIVHCSNCGRILVEV
jgi:hypothetical protein